MRPFSRDLSLLFAFALLVAAGGCEVRAVTELVVVVDTNLSVPGELDGIDIEITRLTGAPVRSSRPIVGPDAVALPVSLGVVHRGGALGPVVVTVRGLRGTEVVVSRDAEAHFVPGRTLVLTLHLEARCVGVRCPVDRQTCELGDCRTIVVARDELRDFDGTLPHLHDGGFGCVGSPEVCNHLDDDCDLRIDEDVDLLVDPLHCGACGNACPSRARARAACAAGLCTVTCEPGFGDCNGDSRDGCEAELDTVDRCAGCSIECGLPHGTSSCALGTCDVQSCAPGWGNCNMLGADGCEAPLNDSAHCGACAECSISGAVESCIAGVCGIAACDVGLGDCNGLSADGCETALTSIAACGACGRACPPIARGTPACVDATCVVARCTAGFADCDGSASNGCEAPLDTLSDCTSCGTACSLANASERCAGRGCEIGACEPGWDDCDGIAANGCETLLRTPRDCGTCRRACSEPTPLCGPAGTRLSCVDACASPLTQCSGACVDVGISVGHCGACDRPCTPANAAGTCAGGACSIAACDPGFGDCNALALDGCETRLNTLRSCGACGATCALAFASASCDTGRCVLEACAPEHGDCDGDGSTGCEALLTSSLDCGACGVACQLPFAAESCASGTCEIVSCEAGRADCDALAGDGCEATLGTLADCRACDDACDVPRASESCGSGVCALVACEVGRGDCNATLLDGCETSLDSLTSCGGCGVPCGPFAHATASCAARTCALTCEAGFGDCNGIASDGCETALTTATSCGGCGVVCGGATSVCAISGATVACQSECAAGMTDCGAECADLLTDERHCGACAVPCAPPDAAGACVAGACRIQSCGAGLADCNATVVDGCERNVRTATDCGACGAACTSAPNATASCPAGSCVATCTAGWGDCDGDAVNGCERSLTTLTSCGRCGNACVGGTTCQSGVCE